MNEYQKICEATKQLTDLKKHEDLIYTNEKLKSIKQDAILAGTSGGAMAVLSLVSFIITVRNPEAISLMCTLVCFIPTIYYANETRKEMKKYNQLKKLQNQY